MEGFINNEFFKEYQLKNCIAYCLFNEFALSDISQFIEDADMHWSLGVNKIYIRNCPHIFYSSTLDNVGKCVVTEVQGNEPSAKMLEASQYRDEDVSTCQKLFLTYLKIKGYRDLSEVGSISYKQSGLCWLTPSLDILLNIPEITTLISDAFGITERQNESKMHETFMKSSIGKNILKMYKKRVIARNDVPKTIKTRYEEKIKIVKPFSHGYPEELMVCIREKLGIMYVVKCTTNKHYKKARDMLDLILEDVLVNRCDQYSLHISYLWRNLQYYEKRFERFRGAILTGFKKDENTGHAISICKVSQGILNVFDGDNVGQETLLGNFLKTFNRRVTLTMYEYHKSFE